MRTDAAAVTAVLAFMVLIAAPSGAEPAAAKTGRPALARDTEPVVLTGQRLAALRGAPTGRVVAYRFRSGRRGGRWIRVPVQIDERAVVDFGKNPADDGVPEGARTVYGTAPSGLAALQYSDPSTFVGPDPNPRFDADDELVFMARDAGAKAPRRAGRPRRTRRAGAAVVVVRNPVNGARRRVYLFRSRGKPGRLRRDYVSYRFRLASGDYRATYDVTDGPNPETSFASTANYTASFSDRWYFDGLRIRSGKASGADILDGYKFGFMPGYCGRSEATFNGAEGAFVANRDGPVRAIRSYIGANSGPYTQRTHLIYARRHEIVTDLRVHPIPGLFTHYDLSTAGLAMTYYDELHRSGVKVDGVDDALGGGAQPGWHLWTGGQGALVVAERVRSSFAASFNAAAVAFQLDDSTPPFTQCWGDSQLLGAAGVDAQFPVPGTRPEDPDFFSALSTDIVGPPGLGPAAAAGLARQVGRPLRARVNRVRLRAFGR